MVSEEVGCSGTCGGGRHHPRYRRMVPELGEGTAVQTKACVRTVMGQQLTKLRPQSLGPSLSSLPVHSLGVLSQGNGHDQHNS